MRRRLRPEVKRTGPGRYTSYVWLLGRMGYELIHCMPAETRQKALDTANGFIDRLRTAIKEYDDATI